MREEGAAVDLRSPAARHELMLREVLQRFRIPGPAGHRLLWGFPDQHQGEGEGAAHDADGDGAPTKHQPFGHLEGLREGIPL